jgi:hypothetical protein
MAARTTSRPCPPSSRRVAAEDCASWRRRRAACCADGMDEQGIRRHRLRMGTISATRFELIQLRREIESTDPDDQVAGPGGGVAAQARHHVVLGAGNHGLNLLEFVKWEPLVGRGVVVEATSAVGLAPPSQIGGRNRAARPGWRNRSACGGRCPRPTGTVPLGPARPPGSVRRQPGRHPRVNRRSARFMTSSSRPSASTPSPPRRHCSWAPAPRQN